jgi:hypothetical protein
MIQVFETMEKFPEQSDSEAFFNVCFFMMTSISVIGYGHAYASIYTRILLIFLLAVIMASIGE